MASLPSPNKRAYDDLGDTAMADETAWTMLNPSNPTVHKIYDIRDETKETIPVLTEILNRHGLDGLNGGDVVEIIGNEQCGKSQLLYQHLVRCCLPSKIKITKSTKNGRATVLKLGGANSRAIWFDLNFHFDADRLFDVFVMAMKRKIIKHNLRRMDVPWQSSAAKRHSVPLHFRHNQSNPEQIEIVKMKNETFEVDENAFFESTECDQLWQTVHSRISVVSPLDSIHFIASLHKFESMLNVMSRAESGCDDDGFKLVLIDDINAFFNELSANNQRDKFCDSMSSILLSICNKFGLILIFSRFCAFKSERDWLRNHTQNNNAQNDDFFSKFGRFELEKKALFVLFLYRDPLQCVDSTVTHPAIGNDLFHGHCQNESDEQRKLYLLGDQAMTNKFIQNLSVNQLDPMRFILNQTNNQTIRGLVITNSVFLRKASIEQAKGNQNYKRAVLKKQIIRFNANINVRFGFIWTFS